jgi:serine protease Do
MAIGNPGGYDFKSSVTSGIVSAKNRPMDLSNGYVVNCIQTDAAINPGNSGGALVNIYGQVVGINSAKIVAEGYESLGFAISTVQAKEIINDLVEFGYIKDRATLGITGAMVTNIEMVYYEIPMGIKIADILNSSVSAAGVVKNDIIVKIEDKDVTSINVINSVLQKKSVGDSLALKIYRYSTNTYIDVTVTLADYNEIYGEQS